MKKIFTIVLLMGGITVFKYYFYGPIFLVLSTIILFISLLYLASSREIGLKGALFITFLAGATIIGSSKSGLEMNYVLYFKWIIVVAITFFMLSRVFKKLEMKEIKNTNGDLHAIKRLLNNKYDNEISVNLFSYDLYVWLSFYRLVLKKKKFCVSGEDKIVDIKELMNAIYIIVATLALLLSAVFVGSLFDPIFGVILIFPFGYPLIWAITNYQITRDGCVKFYSDGLKLSRGLRRYAFIPYSIIRSVSPCNDNIECKCKNPIPSSMGRKKILIDLIGNIEVWSYFGFLKQCESVCVSLPSTGIDMVLTKIERHSEQK